MKWLYLPILFALAFTYTRVSQNSFMLPEHFANIKRSPATLEESLKYDADFYAYFRATVSLFYQQLKNENFQSKFQAAAQFRGTIAGDFHAENFGFVLDDNNRPLFVLNDFDDTTEGIIFYDVFRHFISAKIISPEMTWREYFDLYQKGLIGQPHENSFYISNGLENAPAKIEEILKESVSYTEPFRFSKHKSGRPTTDSELKVLEQVLTKKFPKIKIYDHYVRIKKSGGSAGVKRFQVLARVRPQDEIRWLDIKEVPKSGYDKVFNENSKSLSERISQLKDVLYEGKFNATIDVVTLEKTDYSLRYVDQFAYSLKLEDIPDDDYFDVLLDQAYAIGKMHRSSLKDETPFYMEALKNIDTSFLEKEAANIKFKLKQAYREFPIDQAQ